MRTSRSSIASIVAVAGLVAACSASSSPTPAPTFTPTPATSAASTGVSPATPSPMPSATRDGRPSPTWTATGTMVTAHAHHVAPLLLDGRVLVAGGVIQDRIDGQVSTAAELYDPGARTWTATGAMVEPRWAHSATLLPGGRVLAAGSYVHGGDSLASAELYDPGAGTWTATGSMDEGRGGHTATRLPDGTVLVAGGSTSARPNGLDSAEIYDPDRGSWLTAAPMSTARQGHTATSLADGRVLMVGGGGEVAFEEGPAHGASAELYDPRTGRWTATGSMSMARFGHTATLLPDGSVLVVGGSVGDEVTARSAEVYDPTTGAWTVTSSMLAARSNHSGTLMLDGTVLVAGGVGLGSDPRRLATAEVYDPSRGTWSTTASLIEARWVHTATLGPDGRVLVAGDYDEDTGTSAEVYDPGGDT